jgi:TolB protein
MRPNPWIGVYLLQLSLYSCFQPAGHDPNQEAVKIAYNAILMEGDTTNYEVFLMDIDGKNPQNLTKNKAVDWVYQGFKNKIYFISDRDTSVGVYFLYEMNIDDLSVRKVYQHPVEDSWLDTRNHGKELVICTKKDRIKSIIIIDSLGQEVREVIRTNQYEVNDPVFSPEGNWIVYRSTRSGHDELWIVDEYGAYQRQITHYAGDKEIDDQSYRAGPPRWIPNTRAVSYTSEVNGNYSIFQINIDGKEAKQITTAVGDEGWHSWSPDGKLLLYDGSELPDLNSDLFLYNMQDSTITQLTTTDYPERGPLFVKKSILQEAGS